MAIALIKKLTPEMFGLIADYEKVHNILVRAERNYWPAKPGDVGLITTNASSAKSWHRSWSITFANGNTGKQYPDLKLMIETEQLEGNFSFFYVEIKP
jgi:hypothetical protein